MEIAVMTARQADLAATFNYASQAHNNHFFFEALVGDIPVLCFEALNCKFTYILYSSHRKKP
jgi:hypothetical protein